MNKSVSIVFALLVSSMLIEMLNAQDVICTRGWFGRERCRRVRSRPQRLSNINADQQNQINKLTQQINDLFKMFDSIQLQVQQLLGQTTTLVSNSTSNSTSTPSVQQRIQLARIRLLQNSTTTTKQQQPVTSPVRAATATTVAPVRVSAPAQAPTQAATQAPAQAPAATDGSGLF